MFVIWKYVTFSALTTMYLGVWNSPEIIDQVGVEFDDGQVLIYVVWEYISEIHGVIAHM